MEAMLDQSPIRWEAVQPGILSDGALTRTYRVMPTLQKGMKVGRIARADVADFLLNQAENPTLLGKRVAISA